MTEDLYKNALNNEKLLEDAKKFHLYVMNQPGNVEFALGPPKRFATLSWRDEPLWTSDQRRKTLETLDLNPFVYDQDQHKLLILLFEMFKLLGLNESLKIPEDKLKSFLLHVKNNYRDVPFHNFFHAFNVTQTMFYFLQVCDAKERFTSIEILALILSCLCHDIDHPGFNNTFQVNAQTSLAMFYNDFSVLEQHHCCVAFKLLSKSECNILVNLDITQYRLLRKYVCACILSTDLSSHGDFAGKLKDRVDKLSWDTFEDKKLIMCCLVKASDISNEIRPHQISIKWAEKVMTEFYLQHALEKDKGLPVIDMMDPSKTTIASGQIGFIQFLCLNFYTVLTQVFPKIEPCVKQMLENKEHYQKIIDDEKSRV